MKIRLNGKPELCTGEGTLSELITCRGLVPERIVIEHNERIVPREEWASLRLSENDSVEIVSFVGGG
jgi:thiamine biosynthesis protein ThiS